MKITSSYEAEIMHKGNKTLRKLCYKTLKCFRSALSDVINVVYNEWDNIVALEGKERNNTIEHLIHKTKANPEPKYSDWDSKYPNMPSYLRRNVISEAIGYVSAYQTQFQQAVENKQKLPKFQVKQNKFPSFYKGNMAKVDLTEESEAPFKMELKLYNGVTWDYFEVKLKNTDLRYIKKHICDGDLSNPTLEYKNKKWFVRFAITYKSELPETTELICAVDLGINVDATCCIMDRNGTIVARKSINFASDKGQIYHVLNKIKKVSRTLGVKNTRKLWRYARNLNNNLADKVINAILDFALEYEVNTIVMESLNFKGKKKGSKKQRLHMWKQQTIQKKLLGKAHKNGIRYSSVYAYGTSKYTFDGTGEVTRGYKAGFKSNRLCLFKTGKQYDCDLSASYNIGARYFLREYENKFGDTDSNQTRKKTKLKNPEEKTIWSVLEAKVPSLQFRRQWTLNTLLEVNKCI